MAPSLDTQAVLLLCCSIPKDTTSKPLTPTEYDRVARTLQEQGRRPADLLTPAPSLAGLEPLGEERLRGLLGRGAALGLLLERWSRLGIWAVGRADALYPPTLKRRLGRRSPPLLYGLGRGELLNAPGVAVVGSRAASPGALEFAAGVARTAASERLSVISGGARGVDTEAMDAALAADGKVVGVLAGGLEKAATAGKYREPLAAGSLCLVSAFSPHAPFSAGLAMARNGHIYCLSLAVFVADSGLAGGTWSGAVEGLKKGWVPVFVRQGADVEPGNALLVREGARWHEGGTGLRSLLTARVAPEALGLFGE